MRNKNALNQRALEILKAKLPDGHLNIETCQSLMLKFQQLFSKVPQLFYLTNQSLISSHLTSGGCCTTAYFF